MDQSQRPAEPVQKLSAGQFIARTKGAEAVESATAQENRVLAGQELSMIFELNDSRAYQWYEAEFVEKVFQEARDRFLSPDTLPAEMPDARSRYLALKEVKKGMLEREIGWRTYLDPSDQEIGRLQMKLGAL